MAIVTTRLLLQDSMIEDLRTFTNIKHGHTIALSAHLLVESLAQKAATEGAYSLWIPTRHGALAVVAVNEALVRYLPQNLSEPLRRGARLTITTDAGLQRWLATGVDLDRVGDKSLSALTRTASSALEGFREDRIENAAHGAAAYMTCIVLPTDKPQVEEEEPPQDGGEDLECSEVEVSNLRSGRVTRFTASGHMPAMDILRRAGLDPLRNRLIAVCGSVGGSEGIGVYLKHTDEVHLSDSMRTFRAVPVGRIERVKYGAMPCWATHSLYLGGELYVSDVPCMLAEDILFYSGRAAVGYTKLVRKDNGSIQLLDDLCVIHFSDGNTAANESLDLYAVVEEIGLAELVGAAPAPQQAEQIEYMEITVNEGEFRCVTRDPVLEIKKVKVPHLYMLVREILTTLMMIPNEYIVSMRHGLKTGLETTYSMRMNAMVYTPSLGTGTHLVVTRLPVPRRTIRINGEAYVRPAIKVRAAELCALAEKRAGLPVHTGLAYSLIVVLHDGSSMRIDHDDMVDLADSRMGEFVTIEA